MFFAFQPHCQLVAMAVRRDIRELRYPVPGAVDINRHNSTRGNRLVAAPERESTLAAEIVRMLPSLARLELFGAQFTVRSKQHLHERIVFSAGDK